MFVANLVSENGKRPDIYKQGALWAESSPATNRENYLRQFGKGCFGGIFRLRAYQHGLRRYFQALRSKGQVLAVWWTEISSPSAAGSCNPYSSGADPSPSLPKSLLERCLIMAQLGMACRWYA
jgi:hypothetical protein